MPPRLGLTAADAALLEPGDDDWASQSTLPSVTVLFPLVSACGSMLMCVSYIAAFCSFKRLRRHPASLVFGRCMYDLLFCAQLAFQLTRVKSALECKSAAVLMQFSMLASESCFAGISADLSFALTEPFHDYKATRRFLHLSIFLGNVAIASALGWLQRNGRVLCHGVERGAECLPAWLTFERLTFGAHTPVVEAADATTRGAGGSGPHSLLVCWVRSPPDGSINWAGAQVFFFLPVLAIYAYALHVYYGRAARRLQSGGLMTALETRRSVLERSRKLLYFYNGYVLVQMTFYLAMFLLSLRARHVHAWASAHYACSELFLVVLGARGIATVTGYLLSASPRWEDEMRSLGRHSKRRAPAGDGGGAAAGCGAGGGAAGAAAGWEGGGGAHAAPGDELAPYELDDDEGDDSESGTKPELNSALREEVLFFTAQGIERAILHAEAAAVTAAPPGEAAGGSALPCAASYSVDSFFIEPIGGSCAACGAQPQTRGVRQPHGATPPSAARRGTAPASAASAPRGTQMIEEESAHDLRDFAEGAAVRQAASIACFPHGGAAAAAVGQRAWHGCARGLGAGADAAGGCAAQQGGAVSGAGVDADGVPSRAAQPAESPAPGAPPRGPTTAAAGGHGGCERARAGCEEALAVLGPSFRPSGAAGTAWGVASHVAWYTREEAAYPHGGLAREGLRARGGRSRKLSSDGWGAERPDAGALATAVGGADSAAAGALLPRGQEQPPQPPPPRFGLASSALAPSVDHLAPTLADLSRLQRTDSAAESVGSAQEAGGCPRQPRSDWRRPRARVTHRGDMTSLGPDGARTTITLTDYEPDTFRAVRAAFGIETRPLLESLRHKAKERFSEGRSGAFLYFSLDYNFIVKTCTQREARTLRKLLPAYARHVQRYPRTLLSKMLGLYSIEIYGRRIYFVVMKNILKAAEGGGAAQAQTLRLPVGPASPRLPLQPQVGVAGAEATEAAAGGGGAGSAGAECARWPADSVAAAGADSAVACSASPCGGEAAEQPAAPALAGAQSGSSHSCAATTAHAGGSGERERERVAIHERYDLKGSWVDRHGASVAELRGQRCRCRYCDRRYVVGVDTRSCPLRFNKPCLPEQQLKDNDLYYKLNLRPALARELAQQLRADADFLASEGLMDYSLLVGVTRKRFDLQHAQAQARTASSSSSSAAGGGGAERGCAEGGERDSLTQPLLPGEDGSQYEAEFVDGPAVYYLGIIDMLQRWDMDKKREYVAKLLIGKNRHGISCVPPLEYAERFKRRVVEAIVEGRD